MDEETRKRRERVEQWRAEKLRREQRLAEEAAKLEAEKKTESVEGVLEDDNDSEESNSEDGESNFI